MKKIKRFLLTIVVLGMAPATWAGPLSSTYSNLIVFGDSIVDTGNTQAAVLFAGFPDPAPASAGYFGGRFTNGVNPADVVNQAIEGTNLTGSVFGGDNYSFGGARARTDGDFIPDLTAQVDAYLNDIMGVADPDALHLINVGGNDVRDILFGADPATTITAAATTIANQVVALQGAGATEFLFVGVGNVGGIPEILALETMFPGLGAFGRTLSENLNTAIEAALTPLGVDFYDSIGFFDDLLPALAADNIITTTSCLVDLGVNAPNCDDYAFFDNVHPTTGPLQLLGDDIVASLVPVPGTGLLLGLGILIIAARRRQGA